MENKFQIGDIVESEFGDALVVDKNEDGEVAIRLLPQSGETYVDARGKIVGVVIEVDDNGTATVDGAGFAAAVASGNIKNPQLEKRKARAAHVLGAEARQQLTNLGLGMTQHQMEEKITPLRIIGTIEDRPIKDWECTPAVGTCPSCGSAVPYTEFCPDGIDCNDCWYGYVSGEDDDPYNFRPKPELGL